MNVCGECASYCVGKCVLTREVKKEDTGETGRVHLACGVQKKKKGERGVKKRKEGKRQERGKQGSEAGSAY